MMIINIQTDAIYTAKNLLNSSNLMPAMPHWMQQQGTPPARVLKGFVEWTGAYNLSRSTVSS